MCLSFAAAAVSSPIANRALPARSPGDAAWNEAVQKGKMRHALINVKPTGKDISTLTKYADLAANGWTSTLNLDQSWSLESDVFDAIAKQYQMQQEKTTKADTLHKDTGAEYRGWLSANPYIVFSMDNHSPKARKSSKKTPNLEHWSDVAFLDYQQSLAQQNDLAGMKKLGLMVSGKINHKGDHAIIEDVINKMGIKPAEVAQTLAFPGRSVKYGSDAFFALLGTANGAGVGRFLSDHKVSLGWKIIKDIMIVYDPKPGLGIDPKTKKRPSAYWLLWSVDDHPKATAK